VLDLWSPDEKAQYPEYFARREEMKKEYIVYWEKKFGNKAEELHHHH
jgi:NADH dehydrogenase (ubiquinone) 1 beta subcomplex subunit 9